MTVQEWMTTSSPSQIMSNVFEQLFTDEPTPIVITKILKPAMVRVDLALKKFFKFELLFTSETTTAMVEGYFAEHLINLLTSQYVDMHFINDDWMADDLGKDVSNLETALNYAGYNVENQQGTFQKTNSSGKTYGGLTKLQYLQFMNNHTNNWVNGFAKWFKSTLLRLIY